MAFSQSSGPVLAVFAHPDDESLVAGGTLAHYTANREELEGGARELFEMIQSGTVKIEVSASYPLAEAARAHRDLEARKTTGSVVLLP